MVTPTYLLISHSASTKPVRLLKTSMSLLGICRVQTRHLIPLQGNLNAMVLLIQYFIDRQDRYWVRRLSVNSKLRWLAKSHFNNKRRM